MALLRSKFKLVKNHLNQYEGLTIRRYNNYFGRSIISRLIKLPYDLATSEVIVVEDVCRPIKYLERSGDQLIVQTWHALGAFKKFGLANIDNLERLENEDKEELAKVHVYDYVLDPGLKFREKIPGILLPWMQNFEGGFQPAHRFAV